MKPIERTLIIVLLAVCAVALALLAVGSLQTATAERARMEYVQSIADQTTANLQTIQAALDSYQDTAYGSGVDRIAEQQLLATETTNILLTKVADQLALLTLLLVK